MEEAYELANYLPLSFKSPKEQEYVEFLWDAFEQGSFFCQPGRWYGPHYLSTSVSRGYLNVGPTRSCGLPAVQDTRLTGSLARIVLTRRCSGSMQ
jgi:hypothetical protein